jgi:UDP-N-acetylglucosamine--N-acetylmuramyl-(pentapeptide) pyrophosphoryl-undecaprenol N-acetylglucosamine transferase
MKIVFTGGGSGGHFYPLIAVAEEVLAISREKNLITPELYYFSNTPYDEAQLVQLGITYKHVSAGKLRTYASLQNGMDAFRTLVGFPNALRLMYKVWPDVVFSKGGYPSVPVVLAAKVLGIPVFVHDSDAVPGRANLLAGKFAERIAISYPDTVAHFARKEVVAYVGNPVRKEVQMRQTKDAHMHFGFTEDVPTILVLGGSQGAEHINSTLLQALPELLNRYQVIHQIGKGNFESHQEIARVHLQDHPHLDRYKQYPYLDALTMRLASGVADLVVSRAGSGSIFEIAMWEVPAILIPIPESVSRDQRENAYAYARAGGAEVIEQHNCTPHLLTAEIDRIFNDLELMQNMRDGARRFKKPEAGRVIAQEILRIALEHELS